MKISKLLILTITLTLTNLTITAPPLDWTKRRPECFTDFDMPNLLQDCPGGDWAFMMAKALELNWCFKGGRNVQFSPYDLICNCEFCSTIEGNGCKGGNVKMAANWIIKNGLAGGSIEPKKEKLSSKPPWGYNYCLQHPQANCHFTGLYGANKCSTVTPFDPEKVNTQCPQNCNVGGGRVKDKRTRNVLKTFIEKQGHSKIKGALINSAVLGFMHIRQDIFHHKSLDEIYYPTWGEYLGFFTVIIIGHIDNHNNSG